MKITKNRVNSNTTIESNDTKELNLEILKSASDSIGDAMKSLSAYIRRVGSNDVVKDCIANLAYVQLDLQSEMNEK